MNRKRLVSTLLFIFLIEVVLFALLLTTVQAQTVDLIWDANPETDLAGYNVYRSAITGSGYTKLNSNILTTLDYTASLADYGITNYFVCTAMNTSGLESDYSNEVSYVMLNPDPPSVPTGLTITQTTVGLSIDWEDVPGAENYRVLIGRLAKNNTIHWKYRRSVIQSNIELTLSKKNKKETYIGIQSVSSAGISAITAHIIS